MKRSAAVLAAVMALGCVPPGAVAEMPEKELIIMAEGDPLRVMEQVEDICAARGGFVYSCALNGFSCTMPAAYERRLEDIPGVTGWSQVQDIAVPELSDSVLLGGVAELWEDSGYRGEGQVIAVLDTELDVTHEMFAPIDDKDNALSYEDIAAAAPTLSFGIDPEQAYVSSKVPFAVSYTSRGLSDKQAYHGTHVCGIAAGDDTGSGAGVACDAQLVFMGVFERDEDTGRYYVNEAAAVAAVDDAVKLDCGVINLSFGMIGESEPLTEALRGAEEAGVTVVAAAGNESEDSFRGADRSTVTYPATLDSVLSAGSADNAATGLTELGFGGDRVVCSDQGRFGELEGQEIPLALIYPGQYGEVELSGRLAVFLEDGGILESQCEYAAYMGAVGVISTSAGDRGRRLAVPGAAISPEELERLTEASPESVTVHSLGSQRTEPKVSDFTAWGPGEGLTLGVDILGIGGGVVSAGYEGSYRAMSGTSMASPYIAGCCALLRGSLREQGLEGAELNGAVRSILMNTARPLTQDGAKVSVRRQGAGLVDVSRAARAEMILTSGGRGAVLAGDKLGDRLEFTLDMTRLRGESSVTGARLELWSADTQGNVLNTLTAEPDVTDLNSRGRTEISQDITALRSEGVYLEGYLTVETRGEMSYSLPILGYFGGWEELPAAEHMTGKDWLAADFGCLRLMLGHDPARLKEGEDAPEPEWVGRAVVSPDGDGFGDVPEYCFVPLRNGSVRGGAMISKSGERYELEVEQSFTKGVPAQIPVVMPSDIPEGEYACELYLCGSGGTRAQTVELEIKVDRTPPKLTGEQITEKNGRKILTVTVDDPELTACYITGSGSTKLESGTIPELFSALTLGMRAQGAQEEQCTHPEDIRGYVCGVICGDEPAEYEDVVPMEQGRRVFEYDITDLTQWRLTFLDSAYNAAVIDGTAREEPRKLPQANTAQNANPDTGMR